MKHTNKTDWVTFLNVTLFAVIIGILIYAFSYSINYPETNEKQQIEQSNVCSIEFVTIK